MPRTFKTSKPTQTTAQTKPPAPPPKLAIPHLLPLLGLLHSACTAGVPCQSDADCPKSNGHCDTTLKVCVAGTQNTSLPTECPPTCTAGTLCTKASAGCQPALVSITSPASGATYGVSASVQVAAHVTTADGSPWPDVVPVAIEGEDSSGKLVAPNHEGDTLGAVQLPSAAGTWTLTVGWPGTASASVSVTTQTCNPTCNPWEECKPLENLCKNLELTLAWKKPLEEPSKCGVNKPVSLEVTVSRADGGPFAASLPLTVDGTPRDGLGFDGNSSWKGSFVSGDGGQHHVLVGWDGGPTATRTVEVDNTPPALAVTSHLNAGAQHFQKDDTAALVTLTANEELSDAGLTVGSTPMAPAATCPQTKDGRACFTLDVSKGRFQGLEGGMDVILTGVDMYGNSASTTATVPVTRVRWVAELDTRQVNTLAVGSDGTLYVGQVSGGGATTTTTLNPATGEALKATSAYGTVESLAVAKPGGPQGPDVLYLTYNAPRGSLGALNPDLTTTDLNGPCQAPDTTAKTYAALALYQAGADVIATATMNRDPQGTEKRGAFCLYRHTGTGLTALPADAGQFDVKPPTSSGDAPSTPTNLLVRGQTASLLHYDSINGTFWQPLTLDAAGGGPTVLPPVQVGEADKYSVAVGQALFDGGVLIGAGGPKASRQLFLAPDDALTGSGLDAGTLGSTNEDKGVPAIASATEGYVGTATSLLRFNPSSLETPGTTLYTGDALYTSPVLAAAQPDGGVTTPLGYAVTQNGTLVVFTHSTNTSAVEWTASTKLTGLYPHPTFDKNRKPSAAATNTGLLYVGAEGKVMAVIVDSPRLLDTPGAWPKFQRTQGNAGNDDTQHFPTNWP